MKLTFIKPLIGIALFMSTISCSQKEESTNIPSSNNYSPGEKYSLVWADEFDTASINPENWNFQILEAGTFNEEWQRYTSDAENAYIKNGQLVITAIHESNEHGLDQYTSARLNTADKQSWKYGKIVARIKLPKGEGIWPAFWMLGTNIDENGGDTPWPHSGEIDILELYGSKDDAVIEANLHYADENDAHAMSGPVPFKLKDGIFADDFHIFELEWTEKEMLWSVDGEEFTSASIAEDMYSEFHNEFFILLNVAVGGSFAGRPDDSTIFPQSMYVDWIRVYQKD